jgi:hypothetical protein
LCKYFICFFSDGEYNVPKVQDEEESKEKDEQQKVE